MKRIILYGIMVGVLLTFKTTNCAAESDQLPAIKEVRALFAHNCVNGKKDEIDATLALMKKSNLNIILPEVFKGMASWDSKIALPVEREMTFDPLAYLTEQAYKNDIEVHPAILCFTLGRPSYILAGTPKDIYKRFDKRKPGIISSSGGHRVCFHDEEYRNFMAEIVRELLENYKIQGLNLDLIRTGGKVCVCEDCIEKYKKKYGRDLVEDFKKVGPEIMEWQEAGVGGLVKIISETAKAINPAIKISICAYIPASPSHRGMEGQVPHIWAEKNWVDFILPMVYSDTGKIDTGSIKDYQKAMDPSAVFPLLSIYNSKGGYIPKQPEVVLEQIETVRRECDVKGVGFYFHSYLTEEMAEALGKGPFREKAVLPWKK